MACGAEQCRGVQFIVVYFGGVQCSAEECSLLQFSAVKCSLLQFSAVKCSLLQCNTMCAIYAVHSGL